MRTHNIPSWQRTYFHGSKGVQAIEVLLYVSFMLANDDF